MIYPIYVFFAGEAGRTQAVPGVADGPGNDSTLFNGTSKNTIGCFFSGRAKRPVRLIEFIRAIEKVAGKKAILGMKEGNAEGRRRDDLGRYDRVREGLRLLPESLHRGGRRNIREKVPRVLRLLNRFSLFSSMRQRFRNPKRFFGGGRASFVAGPMSIREAVRNSIDMGGVASAFYKKEKRRG